MKYGYIGEKNEYGYLSELYEKILHEKYEIIIPENIDEFLSKKEFCAIGIAPKYNDTVMSHLDYIDDHAQIIGVVDTVVNRNGRLCGYNVGFSGFCALIAHSGIELKGKRVLVIGDNENEKTVCAAISSLGVDVMSLVITGNNGLNVDEYKEYLQYDVIINASHVGRYPRIEKKAVDVGLFLNLSGVIDIVGNPLKTALLDEASNLRITAVGGLYMDIRKAMLSVELITGEKIRYGDAEKIYFDFLHLKQNIVLTGISGSGKTEVGSMVASILGRDFVDVNSEFEKRHGSKCDFLKHNSETAFRDREEVIINELSLKTGIVIATSGETVMRSDNVRALKANGRVFFLDRSPEKIPTDFMEQNSTSRMSMIALYGQRYPVYKNSADTRIDGNGNPVDVSNAVVARFNMITFEEKLNLIVINGPGVDLLGRAGALSYGKDTYENLCDRIRRHAEKIGVQIEIFQSNHEGAIIDKIHASIGKVDGIIINASSYKYTSCAISTALKLSSIPVVDVQFSARTSAQESLKDLISPLCMTRIFGQGISGYLSAIDKMVSYLQ